MKLRGMIRKIIVLPLAASMLLSAAAIVHAEEPAAAEEEAVMAVETDVTEEIVTEPESKAEEEAAEEAAGSSEEGESVTAASEAETEEEKETEKPDAEERVTAEDTIKDDPEEPEEIVEITDDPEELREISVEYSFLVTGEEESLLYLKFNDPDVIYQSASLRFSTDAEIGRTEGMISGSFAEFSLPEGAQLLSVHLMTTAGEYDIDLQKLEKEELEETIEGYLTDEKEEAPLMASSDDAGNAGQTNASVIKSGDLSAASIKAAIGTSAIGKSKVVMIDPGHGGGDSGAVWTWDGQAVYESHLNLAISKLLKKELANYGITAYLTRTTDVNVDWEERVRKASEAGAAVLVSVHIDTAGGSAPGANGVSVFQAKIFDGSYNQSNAASGQKLAKLVIRELVNAGFEKFPPIYIEELTDAIRYPNGASADAYKIIRFGQLYNVPSIIIEHGFIDNEHDYRTYLQNDAARKKVAAADARAIASYFGKSIVKDETPGWHTDAGGRYYITSKGKTYSGWKTIGKDTYYFEDDGYVATGTPIINGAKYCFDEKGRQQTGWQTIGDWKLYFSKKTGKACLNGKYKISGKYYLFNPDGVRFDSGIHTVKGKKYRVVKSVLKGGWYTTKSGKKYYFSKKSFAAAAGWRTISGKRYYFSKKNFAAVTGWQTIAGKRYYFNKYGVQKTGFKKIGKHTWYLYKKGGFATGTPIINKKKYCFDAKGRQIFGWYDLTDDWRIYCDPNDRGALCTTSLKQNGATWKFNSDGVLIGKKKSSIGSRTKRK